MTENKENRYFTFGSISM